MPRVQAIAPAVSSRRAFDGAPLDALTLGAEEEFLLLHPQDGALACIGSELVAALAPDRSFTQELRAAQIETLTPVCRTVADVQRELTRTRATLARAATGLARPIAVPVNPLSAEVGPTTNRKRYLEVVAGAPWARHSFLACGMHVHVGIGDADRAVAVHDALRSYLPLLGALAANSPVYDGADTGVASARHQLKQLMPRFGVPPLFRSWETYERFVAWGGAGGLMRDSSYQWYDLRLNPLHGTVEVRVFDVQTDVRYAGALVALTQALVSWLATRYDDGERLPTHDHHRIHEALWLASRDGAGGALPDWDTGVLVPIEEQLAELLPELRPHADALGCASELDSIWEIRQRPGHERQRRALAGNGLAGLVDWLADETIACETPLPLAVPDAGGFPSAAVRDDDGTGWPLLNDSEWPFLGASAVG